MQGFTAPPRDNLGEAQVRSLLAGGPQVQVSQGCDLLDTSNNVVADISADMLEGGEITGDNPVTGESIAGKCQLKFMRALAWGKDRVRPWVSLTAEMGSVTSTTVIDRAAASASRIDDTTAEWAQGTLASVVAASNVLTLPAVTTTVFSDNFETFAGWTATGITFASSSTVVHGGTKSGLKSAGTDQTGKAAKSLGSTLSGAWTAEAWVYQNSGSGGGAVRWYLADGADNGYGVQWSPQSTGYFLIERRNGGVGTAISSQSSWTVASGAAWVRTVLACDGAGGLTLSVYTAAGTLVGTITATDTTYSGMTTVNVRGGAGPWYIDDITVTTPGYATSGNRVSPALDLSGLVAVDSSAVSWTATTPTGTAVKVETSVDGGATWQTATNGGVVSGATPGGSVLSRATLTGNGSATPTLSVLSVTANQSQVSHVVTSKMFGPVTAKWYQGVYVLTTPQQPSGETPATYDVQGYDLTSILLDQVGDTYVVAAGTTYLQALRNVLTASGVGANLLLAGDAGNTALPYTMVWCLYDGGPSWLSICADLLESIGYNRLWADEVGNLRSEPKVASAAAPVAWVFDATDAAAGIVAPGWSRDEDYWSAPNKWTFIQSNTNGVSPTTDNGLLYKVTNQSDGPSSIDSLGRVRFKYVPLDVPDAATLKARADLAVAADKSAGTQINMQTFFPAAGHGDVVQFVSEEHGTEKFPVQTWTTNLDGTPGSWVLGEKASEAASPLSVSAAGTVTQASPLRVVMDGATVDSPANSLDGAAYAVGNRVSISVRNPVPPLIQGVESAIS